jgi:hypothetical protein
MDEGRSIAVSPRHSVFLAAELCILIDAAPRKDFVVRTIARREANDMPLMAAELVIASADTRAAHPGARAYPLHFRKTYFPGRMHGDPKVEFDHHMLAYQLCSIPPPIGYGDNEFRSCLIPGQPYSRLSPFGGDPPENNIAKAEAQTLPATAGLWRLAEEMLAQLQLLHDGGLAHGDAELHNCIICPSPLEPILIDFESAVRRETLSDAAWKRRCELDLEPILREAVYLQCALGRQTGRLGELAWTHLDRLFKTSDSFRRAIESRAAV